MFTPVISKLTSYKCATRFSRKLLPIKPMWVAIGTQAAGDLGGMPIEAGACIFTALVRQYSEVGQQVAAIACVITTPYVGTSTCVASRLLLSMHRQLSMVRGSISIRLLRN